MTATCVCRLFNLRMAKKMRQLENVDIFIVTYTGHNFPKFLLCTHPYIFNMWVSRSLENKTAEMIEWGNQHDVKIFDFGNVPHLNQENVKTNQRWNKWCGMRTMICNVTTELAWVGCLSFSLLFIFMSKNFWINCAASEICSRWVFGSNIRWRETKSQSNTLAHANTILVTIATDILVEPDAICYRDLFWWVWLDFA